jgi:hypothetical protein
LSVLGPDGSDVLFGAVYGMLGDGDDEFIDELVVKEDELRELSDAFIQTLLSVDWIV